MNRWPTEPVAPRTATGMRSVLTDAGLVSTGSVAVIAGLPCKSDSMMRPMLNVEDAQAGVMAEVTQLGSETVAFGEAFGRVLREDVVAPHDAPEADNSAMDGYAVRAEDVAAAPVHLRVIGDIPAGHPASA